MFKLLKYLKHYKKESVLAPIFKMIEAIFDLLVPIVVARLIDKGIKGDNSTYILQMGGLLVLLAIVGIVIAVVAQYFAAKAAAGFGTGLRHDLFKHITRLSYSDLDREGASTLVTRLTSDINMIQAQVNMSLRLLMRSPVIIIGAVVMAFLVDSKVAIVFVIAVPVLAIVVIAIMMITIPLYNKVQHKLDKVMISTRENLTGVQVIRAFNKQQDEIDNYNEQNDTLNKFQVFAGKIANIMNPATYVIINVAIIGILLVGGDRVNSGYLTQGQVVALVNYMLQILVELVKLAGLIINLTKAFASAGRINDIFAIPEEANKGTLKVDNYDISFENVSMRFDDASQDSLTNLSFTIKEGERVGIIGATGSGKSTLINLLPRFYDVTSGSLKIGGKKIEEYDLESLRKTFAIVSQNVKLFAGDIRSNLRFGNDDASEEDMLKALDLSMSYKFVMEKEGLDTKVLQGGSNFSGGQKQRLTIARALTRMPKVLVLDDSSSALDQVTDKNLRQKLKSLDGMSMIIVSQRTNSIEDMDKIIVLEEGEIVGMGKHDELLNTCRVYKEIYESQYKQNIYTNKIETKTDNKVTEAKEGANE